MKKDQVKQLAGLSIKELSVKTGELKKEIASLVFDKNMKKLKDVKSIHRKKKELAQTLTFLRQKELLEELQSKVNTQSKEGGKKT